MPQVKRNYLIDNLKVLLIFFVVFGHVIEHYILESSLLKSIYIFIYFFHMPLFIFVSGYLSKDVEKCRKGLVKSLLIPYVVFNIIWYTLAYIATGEWMLLIIYPGWTLWYLLSLFFWRFSLKYLVRFKHIMVMSIMAGLVIGALPKGGMILSLSRTITFLPFFLLGYYTSEEQLNKIVGKSKEYSILGIIIALCVAVYLGYHSPLDPNFFYHSEAYTTSGISTSYGILGRGLLYIGATLLSICVVNLLPRHKVFFTDIGKKTMGIYLFHPYLTLIVYAVVYVLQLLVPSILSKLVILFSPLLIMYLLSRERVDKAYKGIFHPINKVVYSPKIWMPYKKGYQSALPKIKQIKSKIWKLIHL